MRAAACIAAAGLVFAAAASAQVDPRTPQVLQAVSAQLGQGGFGLDARFAIAFTDLNDDHRQEAVVHLVGPNHCGTGGCTTFVLTPTEAAWVPIGRMTASRLPIYRLPELRSGWFDLGVYVGGGGTRAGVRAVRHSGMKYASNPSKGAAIARLPQQATLVMPATSEFVSIGR